MYVYKCLRVHVYVCVCVEIGTTLTWLERRGLHQVTARCRELRFGGGWLVGEGGAILVRKKERDTLVSNNTEHLHSVCSMSLQYSK